MQYHYVIDRPASETDPTAVNIGPTGVDFSMLPGTLIPESEANLMKRWAAQDLSRFYVEQRSNRYSA